MDLNSILAIIKRGEHIKASDIHLVDSHTPIYRVNGTLVSFPEDRTLVETDIKDFVQELLGDEVIKKQLEANGQVDFAQSIAGVGRIRINLYLQNGTCAMAIRILPKLIPNLLDVGLPPIVIKLLTRDTGLIIVTGPTGSGKTTTLAAMIDFLNQTCPRNIITLEDPIEYLHKQRKCIISQREVGSDTASFASGLRAALRQDPDLIMIGEMRDVETISTALTASSTGHLVLASVHSGSTVQTIERIAGIFPPDQQFAARAQLANALLCIVSQQLIPDKDGTGRVLGVEVLVMNKAINNLIRENKIHQIYSAIQTGGTAGMVSMDKAVHNLYQQNKISRKELNRYAREVRSDNNGGINIEI